jgi:hypothetical protein
MNNDKIIEKPYWKKENVFLHFSRIFLLLVYMLDLALGLKLMTVIHN